MCVCVCVCVLPKRPHLLSALCPHPSSALPHSLCRYVSPLHPSLPLSGGRYGASIKRDRFRRFPSSLHTTALPFAQLPQTLTHLPVCMNFRRVCHCAPFCFVLSTASPHWRFAFAFFLTSNAGAGARWLCATLRRTRSDCVCVVCVWRRRRRVIETSSAAALVSVLSREGVISLCCVCRTTATALRLHLQRTLRWRGQNTAVKRKTQSGVGQKAAADADAAERVQSDKERHGGVTEAHSDPRRRSPALPPTLTPRCDRLLVCVLPLLLGCV